MQLGGIHHITAITGNASQNMAFYTQVLGMRLVKKTVNQDDVSAYHLFYADESGHPGTDLTFFDWPMAGPSREGAGMISSIFLGVRGQAALNWWAQRLESFGIAHDGIQTREDGRAILAFRDPEGQRLAFLDDEGRLAGVPWKKSPVPAEMAIRGLYGTRFTVKQLERTERILTGVLGFRGARRYQAAGQHEVVVFEVGPGGPGTEVHVEVRPDLPFGRVAIGGVHHVAFRTPNDEEHRSWRERLAKVGANVTPVIDRFYFRSIYFREPGGILCEIATDGPGFTTDEDLATLGESLALPPFLEPHRPEIEAGLQPITPVEFANRA
jgi:glyoxalase family protein